MHSSLKFIPFSVSILASVAAAEALHAEEKTQPATTNNQEIVITAESNDSVFAVPYYEQTDTFVRGAPLQHQVSLAEAMNLPGLAGDPVRFATYMPGIVTNADGELLIHASKPRESSTSLNHLPIGYLFHMGGLHSVISPEAVEQLDVYTGSFDVTYDNAIGGVLDITPRYPLGNNTGYVHMGIFDSSLGYDWSVGESLKMSLNARRSYIDLFLDKAGELNDDITYTVFPNYWDLNYLATYTVDNHLFSIESILAGDELTINDQHNAVKDPEASGTIDASQGFESIGFRWRYFGDTYETNTLLSYLHGYEEVLLFDDHTIDVHDHTITMYHLSQWDMDKHAFSAGCEIQQFFIPINLSVPSPPEDDEIDPDLTSSTVFTVEEKLQIFAYEFFFQDLYSFTDTIRARFGLRANNAAWGNYDWTFMPRTALIVDLTDNDTLSVAAGRYSRTANGYKYLKDIGNPDTIDEMSNHYSAAWTHLFNPSSSLTLEPFYKTFDNLSIVDATKKYANEGDGYVYGTDITFSTRTDELYIYATYAYQQSERELDTSASTEFTFYQEVPHSIQLASSYKLNDQWTLSGLMKYSSGKPYTPIIGTYTDSGRTRPTYGTPYSQRLPDRFTFNLKIARSTQWDSGRSLEMSFEIRNLTNHRNVAAIRYDDQYNEDGYYYDLPILPAIDITYRF